MKLKTRLIILASSLGFATMLSSCQSTASPAAVSDAVMCDKCKTVWVNSSGKPYMPYRVREVMTCPDCTSAIANFVKTGQLKHTCATCGGSLSHCTKH